MERSEEELKEKLAAHRQEKAKPVRLTEIQQHAAKQREMQKEHRAARAAASHDAQIQELKAQVRCPSPWRLPAPSTLDELKSRRPQMGDESRIRWLCTMHERRQTNIHHHVDTFGLALLEKGVGRTGTE